jgi:ABC-type lipoprotein export system ATPase subunit
VPIVEIDDLWKSYRLGDVRVPVLQGVSLRIERGEFVAVSGPSGSGKSTLLYVIGLLDRPDRGRYLLHGRDVGGLSGRERAHLRNETFGFVFQTFNLLPRATVLSNVLLPTLYARRSVDGRTRAADLIDLVGLRERVAHRSNELSGGEQQRVAIARALIMNPQILLADEPTGNLDQKTGREILGIFQALHAQGLTVILVTHDPQVGTMAGRSIRLEDGRVLA